jgi:hypothetical protein
MGKPEALVERGDVAVMLRRVPDESSAIREAWAEVEGAVGSLRGRKFYGAFDPTRGGYSVCVALHEGDDPGALGMETGTLPGGLYVRVRLEGEPPAVYDLIGPTMRRLAQRPDRDPARPEIEFYRRRDQIDLLLPVLPPS